MEDVMKRRRSVALPLNIAVEKAKLEAQAAELKPDPKWMP